MLPSNAPEWEAAKPPPKKGGARVGGGLWVTIGLLVVLVGVIAFAVTRMPTGTLSRPAATTTAGNPAAASTRGPTTATGGVLADPATQQTIQDVIRRLDEAQALAIASKDENVMAATATPEFFAE